MDKELDDLEPEEIEEAPEAPEPPDEDRAELEEEARKYGWRPKEEFDRDPGNWVDAERFLSMPRTMLKIERDRRRDTEKTAKELEQRIARMEGMTKVATDRALEAQRLQYEARIQEIEARKRAAVEVGDTDTYDRLAEQQNQIRPPRMAPPPPVQEDPLAEYKASESGRWALDPHAARMGAQLIEQNPHIKYLPPIKQAEWAAEQIKPYFREYFPEPKPAPSGVSKVDGGGLGAGFKRGKGGADLPPEARKQGQEFVEMGVYKSLDEYAKDYFEQGA